MFCPRGLAASVGRIACRQIDEADVNNHDMKNAPRLQQPGMFPEPRAAAGDSLEVSRHRTETGRH